MDKKILSVLLDQIGWQRHAEGSYRHDDPLLGTQDRLRQIRDGKDAQLTKSDLALLKRSLENSIRKVDRYDYGMDVASSAKQRQETLAPLLDALQYVQSGNGNQEMANALTTLESDSLAKHEATIERGKTAFIEVGQALQAIRDGRLYRVNYKTFPDYCMGRWNWDVSNAVYYIGAAQVAKIVTQVTNLEYTQARELARLANPSPNGDGRKKEIDAEAVQEVASKIDFATATSKDVARAVDVKLAERRNQSVTYKNQPAIEATGGTVPLAGTSHVYTVNKLLWPEEVEALLESLLIGESLHLCCGKSKLGTKRLDLHEPDVDYQVDAANTGLDDKSFDTVLCDPPYNGEMQWNHDLLTELARLASRRIIFQHWFIPADPDGLYKKANYFKLTNIYVWQPRTYFGRAQLISVFDAQ